MKLVKTSCSACLTRCGLNIFVEDGKVVRVEGMPEHPLSHGYICPKGKALTEMIYHPERLKYPLKKENDTWKRISWEEALDIIAKNLQTIKDDYGPESLSAYVGGVVFYDGMPSWALLRRFLDVYGSPNYFSVDSMCYRPRQIAYTLTLGDNMRQEVQNSRTIMVLGANVDNSNPIMGNLIRQTKREKGSKLIVVDPKRIALAKEADIHIQLRPGTDCAFLLAMTNVIITEGLYDREFVDRYTVGFEKLATHVKHYTPEWAAEITWVPAEKIKDAARLFSTNKPSSIYQGFCTLDQATSGFQSSRAVCILEAITGNVDTPGGFVPRVMLKGVKPVRLPHMLKAEPLWKDKYPLMYDVWGRPMGEGQCLEFPEVILTGKPYPIKAMIISGSNPALTWPNSSRAVEALKKVEFLVVMDMFMTPTAKLANLVLPAASLLEKTEFVIDNRIIPFVMLKKKVIEYQECWHDAKFWLQLAKKMGFEEYFPWEDPEQFIDWWLEPSGLSLRTLEDEMEFIMLKLNYGAFIEKGFPTPSGKIEIYSETMEKFGYDPLPAYREPFENPVEQSGVVKEYPLILTTGARNLCFTHTQMRNIESIRKEAPGPSAEIHPDTARLYNVRDGEMIIISTKRGSIKIKAKATEDMPPGVVSIPHGWEEANCNTLTFARPADPVTGVPNYKATLCKIETAG